MTHAQPYLKSLDRSILEYSYGSGDHANPAAAVPSRNSPNEKVARYAVEVVKIAKASLDDGE